MYIYFSNCIPLMKSQVSFLNFCQPKSLPGEGLTSDRWLGLSGPKHYGELKKGRPLQHYAR